jgi:hypothetical protein
MAIVLTIGSNLTATTHYCLCANTHRRQINPESVGRCNRLDPYPYTLNQALTNAGRMNCFNAEAISHPPKPTVCTHFWHETCLFFFNKITKEFAMQEKEIDVGRCFIGNFGDARLKNWSVATRTNGDQAESLLEATGREPRRGGSLWSIFCKRSGERREVG